MVFHKAPPGMDLSAEAVLKDQKLRSDEAAGNPRQAMQAPKASVGPGAVDPFNVVRADQQTRSLAGEIEDQQQAPCVGGWEKPFEENPKLGSSYEDLRRSGMTHHAAKAKLARLGVSA